MKQLIEFINKYSDAPKGKIIFLTIVSGAAYAIILGVINTAAESVSTGSDDLEVRLFFMFLITFVLHLYAKKFSMERGILLAEEIIRSIRVGIIGKIRHTELRFLEKTGKGLIYARLTEDTEDLSQSAPYIVMAAESVVSLVAVFFYMALQSLSGFILVIFLLGLSIFVYTLAYIPAKKKLELSRVREAEFFEGLNDVLSGFKEIRINYQKNEELFADLTAVSKDAEQLKAGALVALNSSFIVINAAYFIMIGGIVFALPAFDVIDNAIVIHLVASLLFLWGPLMIAFRAIPQFMISSVSIHNIDKLEAEIDSFDVYVPEKRPEPVADFKEIALHSVKFGYAHENGTVLFQMGPLDFTLKKGEVVFIVGGNGSGKSTLMHILTGLYYPDTGGISIDGKRVLRKTYQPYRELFSTIFTDFHLFKTLYGIGEVDEDKVNRLLRQMELDHKTGYAGKRFTNIGLSTGQKKRIAYITCLLEDKPVYVFDEWAADQDPEFRKNFYEKFLEDMRAMGKTVVAVSHDDRYFNMADRVIKMEMGKIVSLK